MYDPMVPCRFRIGRLSGSPPLRAHSAGDSVLTDLGDFLCRHPYLPSYSLYISPDQALKYRPTLYFRALFC
jgi:hypothetical protein